MPLDTNSLTVKCRVVKCQAACRCQEECSKGAPSLPWTSSLDSSPPLPSPHPALPPVNPCLCSVSRARVPTSLLDLPVPTMSDDNQQTSGASDPVAPFDIAGVLSPLVRSSPPSPACRGAQMAPPQMPPSGQMYDSTAGYPGAYSQGMPQQQPYQQQFQQQQYQDQQYQQQQEFQQQADATQAYEAPAAAVDTSDDHLAAGPENGMPRVAACPPLVSAFSLKQLPGFDMEYYTAARQRISAAIKARPAAEEGHDDGGADALRKENARLRAEVERLKADAAAASTAAKSNAAEEARKLQEERDMLKKELEALRQGAGGGDAELQRAQEEIAQLKARLQIYEGDDDDNGELGRMGGCRFFMFGALEADRKGKGNDAVVSAGRCVP